MTNNGVICIKSNTRDKEGLHIFANQIAQIAQSARGINIVDVLITSSDSKNLLKQLKRCDENKEFAYVCIYSPNQICNTPEEYKLFVAEVRKFGATVCYNRTPY